MELGPWGNNGILGEQARAGSANQLSTVNQSEHCDFIDKDKTKHRVKLLLVLDTNLLMDIEHSSICICCSYLELLIR